MECFSARPPWADAAGDSQATHEASWSAPPSRCPQTPPETTAGCCSIVTNRLIINYILILILELRPQAIKNANYKYTNDAQRVSRIRSFFDISTNSSENNIHKKTSILNSLHTTIKCSHCIQNVANRRVLTV